MCNTISEAAGNPCRFCRKVCSTFPLGMVMQLLLSPLEIKSSWGDVCISNKSRLRIMQARPGFDKFVKSQSARSVLVDQLSHALTSADLHETDLAGNCLDDNGGKEEFRARMKVLGAGLTDQVLYIRNEAFGRLKIFVSHGIGPSALTREELYEALMTGMIPRGREIWDLPTFIRLVAMGFPFDAKDFILVDLGQEAAFENYFQR